LESLTPTLNNTNTEVITEQENINNLAATFNSFSIEILNDDCIAKLLLYFDDIVDFKNCKCLNKRICRIIQSDIKLQKHAFFLKYCPKGFFELPLNYLLSINNQLEYQAIDTDNNYLKLKQENISSRKKLFFSIEKNLAQAKYLNLTSVATVKHNNSINCIVFSKNNKFFATASDDNTVKISQLINGSWQQLHKLNHSDEVNEIIFSPDERYIITSSYLKHIIWELSTTGHKQIYTVKNVYYSYIYFRNDSKRLFIKPTNRSIQILDLIDNQWSCVFSVDESKLKNFFNVRQGLFIDNPDLPVEIKNDNKWLSFVMKRYAVFLMLNGGADDDYGDKDLTTELKNMLNVTNGGEISNCRLGLNACYYSDDMQLIYASPSKSTSGVILEYTNNQWQLKLKFDDLYGFPCFACFSSDNQRLITRHPYSGKQIYIATVWNIGGDEAYEELTLYNTYLAKFSKDGRYIITADTNNQVKIWQFIDSYWKIKTTINYNRKIYDIVFSNYNWTLAILFRIDGFYMQKNNYNTDILEVINDCEK
jgi:WD40 repeat protein